MATISVKMKVIADKNTKNKIEAAHALFNNNVRKFEEFLLLARAKDYYYNDENGVERYKTEDEAKTDLMEYLTSLQVEDISKCAIALQSLEEVIKTKGSQAAGMLAKLYNAESKAGTNNINKIVEPTPEWVVHYDTSKKIFDDEEWKKQADFWIQSEKGQEAIAPVLKGSGRPSAFKLAYTTGKDWYAQFIKDQEKYKKDLEDGLSKILDELEKAKAFPLVNIDKHLLLEYPIWVKLMLKTALENYASYLACDESTRADYQRILEQYKSVKKIIDDNYALQYSAVNEFLNNNYIQTDRSIYLTRRMCRGLDEIIFEWRRCVSYQERISVLNEWQSDNIRKRGIGDVNFLAWISKDENQYILEGDCIEQLLRYYTCLRDLENKRCCASYTVADPVLSKRYLFYENETGTNYRKYIISQKDNKILVKVPLLLHGEDDAYIEENITFTLAANRQLENLTLGKAGRVVFNNGKKLLPRDKQEVVSEAFVGKLGGADLRVETNGLGKISDAFMSFTITIDDKCDKTWTKDSTDTMFSFSRAYDGKASKYDKNLKGKSLRALSIDMGLKQFGAAAVGEIVYPHEAGNLPDINFERMFLIQMDGEKATSVIEQKRNEANKELWQISSEIRYLSMLKRIYNQDEMGRKKLLAKCVEYYNHPDKKELFQHCLNISDKENVDLCLENEYSKVMKDMSFTMHEFRSGSKTKKQHRAYEPGKSFWAIAYLENLRKVIMSWNSLGKSIDEDNKVMDKRYGITATKLLTHIQNLKDDRIKTGADSIIQSALGYYYDSKKQVWIQKYKPCNVIIFEDLSRYRFSLDRPARENSKLMQWAHREIIVETKRQASIYGIQVYDSTDAAYSSKFCYKTDTPGIRCDRLGKQDFEKNGRLKESVFSRLPDAFKDKVDSLKIGQLVPADIGSIFVTLDKDGRLFQINADMNAACNLQKRFWGMHTHLYRVNTINSGGTLMIKGETNESGDSGFGKRDKGKMLFHYGTDKVMLFDSDVKGHFILGKKEKGCIAPVVGREKVYNLFHDPSGFILPNDQWMGYKEFWNHVENRIIMKLVDII